MERIKGIFRDHYFEERMATVFMQMGARNWIKKIGYIYGELDGR